MSDTPKLEEPKPGGPRRIEIPANLNGIRAPMKQDPPDVASMRAFVARRCRAEAMAGDANIDRRALEKAIDSGVSAFVRNPRAGAVVVVVEEDTE